MEHVRPPSTWVWSFLVFHSPSLHFLCQKMLVPAKRSEEFTSADQYRIESLEYSTPTRKLRRAGSSRSAHDIYCLTGCLSSKSNRVINFNWNSNAASFETTWVWRTWSAIDIGLDRSQTIASINDRASLLHAHHVFSFVSLQFRSRLGWANFLKDSLKLPAAKTTVSIRLLNCYSLW